MGVKHWSKIYSQLRCLVAHFGWHEYRVALIKENKSLYYSEFKGCSISVGYSRYWELHLEDRKKCSMLGRLREEIKSGPWRAVGQSFFIE